MKGTITPATEEEIREVDEFVEITFNFDPNWDRHQVQKFFQSAGLNKVAATFLFNRMTGQDLADLYLDDVTSMGLKSSDFEDILGACTTERASQA